MAKMSWNGFHSKHQNALCCFTAAVSSKLPNGPHLDKKKRKLPTPYQLFLEWATVNLQGDWTSQKVKSGFVLCVITDDDENTIANRFGAKQPPTKTMFCDKTFPTHYRDSEYKKLAIELGYDL